MLDGPCRSPPAHRHHRAHENGYGQERADGSPHPAPECDGEKNEEWVDGETMTDEGRRDDLPLQCGDAEIGEWRNDCLTERGKGYETDDEERRDDDCGTQIWYEVQHRGKHAPQERVW